MRHGLAELVRPFTLTMARQAKGKSHSPPWLGPSFAQAARGARDIASKVLALRLPFATGQARQARSAAKVEMMEARR
jgi:hypothetical protein